MDPCMREWHQGTILGNLCVSDPPGPTAGSFHAPPSPNNKSGYVRIRDRYFFFILLSLFFFLIFIFPFFFFSMEFRYLLPAFLP